MTVVTVLPEVQTFLDRQHGHFIAGESFTSSSSTRLEIINPANKQVISTISEGTADDVEQAVQSSQDAFKNAWGKMSPYERGVKLNALADLIEKYGEELAQLETLSCGKLIQISRHLEVAQSVVFLRYFAGWTTKIQGQTMQTSLPSAPDKAFTAFTLRQPVGVVAGIVPWNFSVMIGIWKIGSALSTGCSIILKPSEFTSLSLLRLAEIAIEAGIPAGTINVVTGKGATGQYLIESPLVRKVSFTGSVPTGIEVGKLAMQQDLTRVSLELGGKNAAIILEDANLDELLPTLIQATFVHQGQVCAAPERFFVHQSKHEEFVTKLSAMIGTIQTGNPMDETSMFGPLSNASHFDKVKGYLDLAADNDQIICGGEADGSEGYFVKPTLINLQGKDDRLAIEETFGPIVGIASFDDENELIELVNSSRFGLSASLWGNNLSQIFKLIPQLDVGSVWVNSHTFLDPAVPFGGTKASGIGREFSDAFIEDYTELKSVIMNY